jgi:hypothetical protein
VTVSAHDFGSILAFTEWNFWPDKQFIAEPDYADYNAPDWGPNGPYSDGNIPLMDFFQLPLTTPRQFVPVSINNNPWPYTCFQNWNCNGVGPYVPGDPDEY